MYPQTFLSPFCNCCSKILISLSFQHFLIRLVSIAMPSINPTCALGDQFHHAWNLWPGHCRFPHPKRMPFKSGPCVGSHAAPASLPTPTPAFPFFLLESSCPSSSQLRPRPTPWSGYGPCTFLGANTRRFLPLIVFHSSLSLGYFSLAF